MVRVDRDPLQVAALQRPIAASQEGFAFATTRFRDESRASAGETPKASRSSSRYSVDPLDFLEPTTKGTSRPMKMRVLAMLAVAVAMVACSSTDGGDAGADPRTIVVRMSDELRFDPATIDVEPGETVRFELTNEGEAVHEFLIGDEAAQAEFEEEMASGDGHHDTDAGMAVDPGQTESFDYTFPDAAGELLAGCHEPGHYDGGMVADITVGE